MDLSNKAIALILVAAIVASFGGTLLSLNTLAGLAAVRGVTGLATDTESGTTTIVITGNVSIAFNVSTVNFGVGYVNSTTGAVDNCTLTTKGVKDPALNCVNFTAVSAPMEIKNDGNTNVSLQLSSDKNATNFLGGTTPKFVWRVEAGNANADNCPTTYQNISIYNNWTNVIGGTSVYVCGTASVDPFGWNSGHVHLHLNLSIPDDVPQGAKSATITATGEY